MRKSLTVRRAVLLSVVSLLVLECPTLMSAAVITDSGTTVPTPGANDVFNLPTSGLTASAVYTNSSSNSGPLAYGETFTTGSNSGGYTLTYVTLQVNFNYDYSQGTLTYPITINSNPNTTNTPVVAAESVTGLSESALGGPGGPDGGISGHFLTYTFDTPVSVAANTQYSFVLGAQTNGGSGAVDWKGTSADSYLSGAAFSNDNGGGPGVSDFVFDVGLTAVVPEPSTYAMVLGGFGTLVAFQRRRRSLPATSVLDL